MYCCVAWYESIKVSEEHTGSTLRTNSKPWTQQVSTFFPLLSGCLAYSWTMKMGAVTFHWNASKLLHGVTFQKTAFFTVRTSNLTYYTYMLIVMSVTFRIYEHCTLANKAYHFQIQTITEVQTNLWSSVVNLGKWSFSSGYQCVHILCQISSTLWTMSTFSCYLNSKPGSSLHSNLSI
jgi:hypothetical protein